MLTRLFVALLLILAVLAPFAGLAPLMGLLLILGLAYGAWTVIQTLVWGNPQEFEETKREGEN
jgi:uncharacterized membrane protein YqjE